MKIVGIILIIVGVVDVGGSWLGFDLWRLSDCQASSSRDGYDLYRAFSLCGGKILYRVVRSDRYSHHLTKRAKQREDSIPLACLLPAVA